MPAMIFFQKKEQYVYAILSKEQIAIQKQNTRLF